MIRQIQIILLLIIIILLTGSHDGLAATPGDPQPVRIGVYIRSGFEACLENWGPTEEYLTKTIPGHDFMIVPLASREDIYDQLQKGKLDFFAANSAIYVCTEERFNTSALCSMVPIADPARHHCTGSIIRKANRNDLERIEDLLAARFSAVKPWSFAGWIMQRQILERHDVDPTKDFYSINFDGTHQEVIQSVLDGSADAGAVASDILREQIKSGQVHPRAFFVFDQKGTAVPLNFKNLASTEAYPNWVFAKTAITDDRLAQKVLESLLGLVNDPTVNRDLFPFVWSTPENYQSVRKCLREMMGSNYAYSTEMIPKPAINPPGWGDLLVMLVMLIIVVILMVAWRRARRRENMVREELHINHSELNEVRAGKNLVETILTRVDCSIDIVDENNEMVYAAPSIEQRYGPWQGRKCHEYYLGTSVPCEDCKKRAANRLLKSGVPYAEAACQVSLQNDHHPMGVFVGKTHPGKLLQVPFYDENGRWLYARVHLPADIPSIDMDIDDMVAHLS